LASIDCDAVILDLEDAVAPGQKDVARRQAVDLQPALRTAAKPVVVRCNSLDTPWGADDLAALAAAGPDAVLLPKIEDVQDFARYAALLPDNLPRWAMIETCAAVVNLAAIAKAEHLEALVFGTNDLMAQMGARSPFALSPARAMTVTAARACGLIALDGVHNDINDDEGLKAACRDAADYGFDGKTLVHPRQVAVCHEAFSPTAAQLRWARAVVAAFASPETASEGVLNLEGVMIERLHLAQALRLIAAHEVASGA
jgi:citrate lyase subunit beta/citryl-CoA lyase